MAMTSDDGGAGSARSGEVPEETTTEVEGLEPSTDPSAEPSAQAGADPDGPSAQSVSAPGFERTDVTFPSGATLCAAWLYLPRPEPAGPAPAVVLGHGLGAVKEMGLGAYAARFAAAGYVAVVFDYRHFGSSGGQPRQLLDIRRQHADWRAAIAYTRGLPQVDPDRVALFGSSFGGGHVIATAARDPRVAAVIAQCPFTSGIASGRTVDLPGMLKLLPLVARDEWARLRHRAPVTVRLAGAPRSPALMNAPDALPGYQALIPPDKKVPEEVAARVALRILAYRPGRQAKNVRCPIMFSVCDGDSVAPARATRRYAARAPRAEVRRYPIGHFDIYHGAAFEQATADHLAFLHRHLPSERTP